MRTTDLAAFAADRRSRQDEAIRRFRTRVEEALAERDAGSEDWWVDLIPTAQRLFYAIVRAEGANSRKARADWVGFSDRLIDALERADKDTNLALWVTTATINAATVAAAKQEPDPVELMWLTMGDDDVREAHQDADRQRRAVGERFTVGESKLRYPGDTTGRIEDWINCRCYLTIVEAADAIAASAHATMSENDTQGADMPENETPEPDTIEAPPPMRWHGILAPEGEWSGDKRMFAKGSLRFRDLPLPLTWQKQSEPGHDGNITVASIDQAEMRDGLLYASGEFLPTVEADELVGLLSHFGRFGVSVDADDHVAEYNETDESVTFTDARVCSACVVPIPAFTQAWVALGDWPDEEEAEPEYVGTAAAGATIFMPKPGEQTITNTTNQIVTYDRGPGWITHPVDTKRLWDYWTKKGQPGYAKINWGVPGDFNRCRVLVGEKIAKNSPEDMVFLNQICARWHHDALGFWPGRAPSEQTASVSELVASGNPPDGLDLTPGPAVTLVAAATMADPVEAAWFQEPELTPDTPVTITPDGRVFGWVAQFGVCHIGFDGICVEAPRSPTNYANFNAGYLPTTDGGEVRIGQITVGGGHAGPFLRPKATAEHYDNVCYAACDVTVGENETGIWMAGRVRPDTPESTINVIRAAGWVSGDWREIGVDASGESILDLHAVLCVNVGGFTKPLPIAASMGGRQVSLVAAGVVVPTETSHTDAVAELAVAIANEIAAQHARRAELDRLAQRRGEEATSAV